MKKILVLVPDLDLPGGVTNYYRILRLDANSNISYFAVNRAKPQGAFGTMLRVLINYIKFIRKILKEHYEIVVVNPSLDMGRSFHRDLVFILICRFLNRKTVVFFRGWFEPYEIEIQNSKWKLFLFRISYAKANEYVVLGKIFKDKLIGLGVPRKTPFYIETTVADSSYINELDLRRKHRTFKEEVNFLFLSRIEKEKGIYIAIDAFRAFTNSYPERKSCFIIAGDGPDLAAVKTYVSGQGIGRIKFLGNVSADHKKRVLLESHIMVFPSFTEGLPNCILEGMLYGMPIISRVTGGIPEVVVQEKNGYLSESYQPSVFKDFLSKVALDSELYERISDDNHQIAMEKYTSEKVRERMLKIYDSVLA